MKQSFALGILVLLVVRVTACGSSSPSAQDQSKDVNTESQSATVSPPASEKERRSSSEDLVGVVKENKTGGQTQPDRPVPLESGKWDGGQAPAVEHQAEPSPQASGQPATGTESPGEQVKAATPELGVSSVEEVEMVDVKAGTQYQAGTRVNFPDLSPSFVIPDGWQGENSEVDQSFVMQSAGQPRLLMAPPHQLSSMDQAGTTLSERVFINEQLVVYPQGQPKVESPWISLRVEGSIGNFDVAGYMTAMIRPGAVGPLYLGLGPPDRADELRPLVTQLASTTKVGATAQESAQVSPTAQHPGQPVATPPQGAAGAAEMLKHWEDRVRGKKLTHLKVSTGSRSGSSTTHYEIYLCSDGQFGYWEDTSTTFNSGAASGIAAGTEKAGGQWRVISRGDLVGIELKGNDGRIFAPAFREADGETYLDDDLIWITDDNPMCS